MTTHPVDQTQFDFDREENAVLSIELLARDRRASTLNQAQRQQRRTALAAELRQGRRTSRSAAVRRSLGTHLVSIGTAIAGSPTDARAPEPLDRPA